MTGTGILTLVDAGNQFELYVGCKRFEGSTLYAKVQNLPDEEPPYDRAGFAGLRVPYDITQYDLRDRCLRWGSSTGSNVARGDVNG